MRPPLLAPRLAFALTLASLAACDGPAPDVVLGVDSGLTQGDVARDAERDVPALDAVTPLPDVQQTPLDVTDAPTPLDVADVAAAPETAARCASNAACGGEAPVCETVSGRCVRCTADDEGACPPSQHCDAMTNRCVSGCRSDEGCAGGDAGAQGRCDRATHSCVECVTDSHCGAGRLCVGTVCVPGCNPGQSCPSGQSCCNGACAEVGTNIAHCGGCGTVCRTPNGSPSCQNGVCVAGSCAEGFADCNRSNDDGCETALRDEVANCGACGNACPTPPRALAPSCVAGRCGFACEAGFANCDNDASNGCEVDLRSSSLHCGLCGNACPLTANSSSATCAAGRCDVTCVTGFGNCDGDRANGCEQPLAASLSHCGRCGNVCPSRPNAAPSCADGACDVACISAFGNCDGDPANGCETNLGTSVGSCGACGRSCSVPNAAPACASGSCAVGSCHPNFADCDRNAANGCEVNLTSDPNNCGACGARRAESCDGVDNDCDGAVDEGCPTGITGLTTFDFLSPSWGGGGGGAYDLQCPSGQFVTGIIGRSGARVDALGLVCGAPRFVEDRGSQPFRYRVELSTAGTVGPVGGGGGGAFRYDCPANSVVMRVEGRAGSRVDQLRVECFRWEIQENAGAWRVVRSPATGGSPFYGGGGGGAFDYLCPSTSAGVPSAMRRAFGGSGSELDRVGVWCTYPVLTTR